MALSCPLLLVRLFFSFLNVRSFTDFSCRFRSSRSFIARQKNHFHASRHCLLTFLSRTQAACCLIDFLKLRNDTKKRHAATDFCSSVAIYLLKSASNLVRLAYYSARCRRRPLKARRVMLVVCSS